MTMCEVTATPMPCPPVLLVEGGETGTQGKKAGVGEKVCEY